MTRGWGLANVLAALNAGITHFESTLGGTGGQPANFVDGVPVAWHRGIRSSGPGASPGLVATEDLAVMLDEMGIDVGVDVDKRAHPRPTWWSGLSAGGCARNASTPAESPKTLTGRR